MMHPPKPRRISHRHPPDQRRAALITAALEVVAKVGVPGATVRAIAAEAGVTPGLIRHYFRSKDDLLVAAYDHHMSQLTERSSKDLRGRSAAARLATFVQQTLSPPVTNPRALQLWAGFMQLIQADPAMREVHEKHYKHYRILLERLIADVLSDAGVAYTAATLSAYSTACNALLDGLWIEGSALPETLKEPALSRLALRSVAKLLELSPDSLENAI